MTTEEIKEIEKAMNRLSIYGEPPSGAWYLEWTTLLLAEVKKLRVLLELAIENLHHDPGCNGDFPPHKCDCGFEETKKQIKEALKS